MNNHNMAVNCAEVIAFKLMRHNDNFAHYNLSNNNFQDAGIRIICDALATSLQVVSLNLAMNSITHEGAHALAIALN